MRRIWELICNFGLLFCVGLSLILSYVIFKASSSDWVVTLDFNVVGEGMTELIVFPIASILGLVGMFYRFRKLRRKRNKLESLRALNIAHK
jgi:TRAP-type C4-dicarboxylate transport system permease small subunit